MPSIEKGRDSDYIGAHKRSSIHRESLLLVEFCGCFHCCEIFSPSLIVEWVDEDDNGVGQTAMCPKCGIDSVIEVEASSDEVRLFLKTMNQHWF